MTEDAFDPTAPLPAPPHPWTGSEMPSPRSGPPYHMTDMIAAEPFLAERLLARFAAPDSEAARLADAIREASGSDEPIVVTGCGTSEHGALGVADILRDALGATSRSAAGVRVHAAQAFEFAQDPPTTGLLIAISHEGGTHATNAAIDAARGSGARTAIITAAAGSPGADLAAITVATGEMDQSWCHTVGYLSPLVAGLAVAGHLTGRAPDATAVRSLLAGGARDEGGAEGIAGRLADAATVLVTASGADRTAGRELVLKIEEAAWLPSAFRDLETLLHGHLPAAGEATGLVAILAEPRARDARIARFRQALAAARELGVRSAAILDAAASRALPDDLTPAGRLVVDVPDGLPPSAAALLATVTPLQLLTERIARARGTNPDPIRRDDPRYLAAAAAAEG